MNEYILILTLIFKTGYGGMGGVEAIEVSDEKNCHRIGVTWTSKVREQRKFTKPSEAFYTCVRK